MENLGILLALGAALAWGTYMVPFKISKSENFIQFQALMGIGILLSGLILSAVAGYSLSINSYGLVRGILWGVANWVSLIAIANLGLSKAIPILVSIVIISSLLWGALAFGEVSSGMITGLIGIGVIILGVVLIGTTGNTQSKNIKRGLVAAVLSGLIFGGQLVPLKLGNVSTEDFFFSSSFGVFITGLTIYFIKRLKFKNEAISFHGLKVRGSHIHAGIPPLNS